MLCGVRVVKHPLSNVALLIAKVKVVPIHRVIAAGGRRHRAHLSHLHLGVPRSRRLTLVRLLPIYVGLSRHRRRGLRVVTGSVEKS